MAADLDGAAARVGMWLRSTVPGDLARVVGTGDGVATDDVAAVLDALAAVQRSAATERAQREAAEGECARLREAIRRQAAAVRVHESARAQMDAHDAATLRSLAGQDRAALIEELAATRRERDDWNARATAMESDRDAAVAQREALAGAVRAAVEHERAVTQRERDEIGAGWFGDLADVPVVAEARAALDALLTEGVGDGR